jgi:GTP-binding protein YchF
MTLICGIVGFPNVGKSTLFNAVLKKQLAFIANYPFATIEPNEGIVEVKDERVDKLFEMSKSAKKIYSTVKMIDIAGLVKGASSGAGLGNKFLSHIREVDLILFVLRGFSDENIIREGSTDPLSDFETLKTELCLKDLETVEKLLNEKIKVTDRHGGLSLQEKIKTILPKIKEGLNNNILISNIDLDHEEREFIKQYCFLTDKPYLILLNVDEKDLNLDSRLRGNDPPSLKVSEGQSSGEFTFTVSAKLENELSEMSEIEQKEYLESIPLKEAPLKGVIRAAFNKLNLIQFFTTGTDETRSWTIVNGSTAPQAAGVIHTDFEKGFIKAEIVAYDDFVKLGSYAKCRDGGKLRQEGKEYVMRDGDIAEFRFN